MSTIAGKTTHTQNSEEIRFSPSEGWSGSWNIEGPKAAVRALLNQLAGLGYSFVFQCNQSPKATVQYETVGVPGGPGTGGEETPTLNWEYFANQFEIDVLETDRAAIIGISEGDKRKIRDAIAAPDPDTAPNLTGNALTVYQLMLGGQRSVRLNVPNLRVSKLVSGSYPVKASLTNVGAIITTNTLIIQEAIPSTILFNLPNLSTTKSGFAYAWYKKHPNVQQAGGIKWNISQEWEYGLWPTFVYGTAL